MEKKKRNMELVIKFRTGPEMAERLDELAASNIGGKEVFLYQPGPLTRSLVIRYLINKAYEEMCQAEREKKEREQIAKNAVATDDTDEPKIKERKKRGPAKERVKK